MDHNEKLSKQIRGKTSTEDENQTKYMIKGDVNVGKSNIIRRLLGHDFQELEATVGVEFGFIEIKDVDPENPNVVLSIQIWDTSGAERYRAITTSHLRNSDGAYLVYDITSETSFQALDFWYDSIKKSTDEDIVVYVVGNKADLAEKEERKVSMERAVEFCKKKYILGYGECSAKTNINIKEIFESFYKSIYKRNKNKLAEKTKVKKKILEGKKKDPKFKCCSTQN